MIIQIVKYSVLAVFLMIPVGVLGVEVTINEIAWMGTPVAGIEEKQWWRYEWLELYNPELQGVSLDGWTLVLYKGENPFFSIPLGGSIATQGYFLIGASDKISGVDVNYSNLGGKFLNTGQKVVLFNSSGVIVDEVDAASGWPAGDNTTKQTMGRIGQGWQTGKEPGGTPKTPNSEGAVVGSKAGTVPAQDQTKPGLVEDELKLNLVQDETEKDLARSSSFQSRVPIVNPITLLAGILALGFSGVLLLVKRSLASRQERQRVEHPERNQET